MAVRRGEGARRPRSVRLPRAADARPRVHAALRPLGRRGDRRRREADVHLRRPRRPLGQPAPRGDRLRRARLHRECAVEPRAGHPLVLLRPHVPARAGAARPAAPVPPDRRRVVRRQRAVGRRRDDRHARLDDRGDRPAGRVAGGEPQLARRARGAGRLPGGAGGVLPRPPATSSTRRPGAASRPTRCASSTRRTPRSSRSTPTPRCCSRRSAPAHRPASPRCGSCSTALGVRHTLDQRLVRGLDYYTATIFEIKTTAGELGAQNTICGGGRYDGLVASLGGPKTPAIGFALGVERTLLALTQPAESYERPVNAFFASMDEASLAYALPLAHRLRAAGISVEVEHRGGKAWKPAQARRQAAGAGRRHHRRQRGRLRQPDRQGPRQGHPVHGRRPPTSSRRSASSWTDDRADGPKSDLNRHFKKGPQGTGNPWPRGQPYRTRALK